MALSRVPQVRAALFGANLGFAFPSRGAPF